MTIAIGVTTFTFQKNQADAVIQLDRFNATLQALADKHSDISSGEHLIIDLQQDYSAATPPKDYTFLTAAGQGFDTSLETASGSIVKALNKTLSYDTNTTLNALLRTITDAHANLATFYNRETTTKLSADDYAQLRKDAEASLTSMRTAFNNVLATSYCDFGYTSPSGPVDSGSCPRPQTPVPELPSDTPYP